MDKTQFKAFCAQEFKKKGFHKVKNTFYLLGKDLLCGIVLQKSCYGPVYYLNFFFCIGQYQANTQLPTYHDSDIDSRVVIMSKTQTIDGKTYRTDRIEYEEYTEDELRFFLEKEFQERILPPVIHGKKFILDNLGKDKLYSLHLHQEEVLRKLKS